MAATTGRWRVVDALTTLASTTRARAVISRPARALPAPRGDGGMRCLLRRGSTPGRSASRSSCRQHSALRGRFQRRTASSICAQRGRCDRQRRQLPQAARLGAGGEVAREAASRRRLPRVYRRLEAKNAARRADPVGVQPLGKDLRERRRAALVELETPARPSEYRIGFKELLRHHAVQPQRDYAAAVDDLARRCAKLRARGK